MADCRSKHNDPRKHAAEIGNDLNSVNANRGYHNVGKRHNDNAPGDF